MAIHSGAPPSSAMAMAFLLLLHSSAAAPPIFIFGDSLTDVGNNNYINSLAKADVRFNGIDFENGAVTGRFCNGRTVPDIIGNLIGAKHSPPPYLAPNTTGESLLNGVNYASGAGGILDTSGANYVSRLSFNDQLKYFRNTSQSLVDLVGKTAATDLIQKAVYFVGFGSNDYINNYFLPFSNTASTYNASSFENLLISTLERQMTGLYDQGARKIVVFGVGPLGCIPSQRVRRRDSSCAPVVNDQVIKFNNRTEELINNLNTKYADAKVLYANSYDVVMDMLNNPSTYGFKVTDRGCCGLGRLNGLLSCMPISNLCRNRKEYIFWDPFHPTDAANLILANRFFNGSLDYIRPMNISLLVSDS